MTEYRPFNFPKPHLKTVLKLDEVEYNKAPIISQHKTDAQILLVDSPHLKHIFWKTRKSAIESSVFQCSLLSEHPGCLPIKYSQSA